MKSCIFSREFGWSLLMLHTKTYKKIGQCFTELFKNIKVAWFFETPYRNVLADVVDEHYRSFNHGRAVEAAMCILRQANSFVQSHQPWLLAKSSDHHHRAVLDCILHVGLETSRVAALALWPVVPALSGRILQRLGCGSKNELSRASMMKSVAVECMQLGPDRGPLFTRIKPSTLTSATAAATAQN